MERGSLGVSWWNAHRFTLLLAGLGVLGTAIVLLRVAHGVGVSDDAKYYIELARALAEGERGLEWLSGQLTELVWEDDSRWTGPYAYSLDHSAWWPPLYPTLLAISGGFALDPRSVAGPFNAVAFGLTVFIAGQWLRARVRAYFLIVLGCALIAFSVALTLTASLAYSEAAFILLTVLALLNADEFLKSGERSALLWAAAFSALACLTRYSGVVLVLTVVPLLALQPGPALRERLRRIGVYLTLSTGPLAVWLLRNYLVTETFTGPRGTYTGTPLVVNIGRSLTSIEAWNPLAADVRFLILPFNRTVEWVIGGVAAGVVLLALAALVAWWALRWWTDKTRSLNSRHTAITVAGIYAFGHMAFTIANAGLGNLALYPRQLTPMYVPLVVVVIVAADALLSNRHRVPRAVSRAPQVLIAALVICAGYAAYVSARDTHTALLNPEYGLNAYVYNAEHIDIETASVKDYLDGLVGDSGPVVRAHFDLYFDDGSLIYFKEECSREDFEHRVFLWIFPVTNLSLPGIHKNVGVEHLSFYPARQGVRMNGECLAIAPLPEYDITLITTGQRRGDTALWEVDIAPAEYLNGTE